MKIGFIGLGNMGGPMAANLVAAGHEVTGFDLAAPMPEGVTKADTAAEAAKGAEVVITMLPNGKILRAVADEIVPAMDKGALFADCSTVDVESARAVADQAMAAGLLAIDAPVSGGRAKAVDGTLTLIVGGDDVHATLRQEAAEGAVAGSDLETASITNQVGQRGDERGGVEAPDALRLN